MFYRSKVLCDTLNLCDNELWEWYWWGIHRIAGTRDQWEYADGTPVGNKHIHWNGWDGIDSMWQASRSDFECSYINIQRSRPLSTDHPEHLKANSNFCDRRLTGICE